MADREFKIIATLDGQAAAANLKKISDGVAGVGKSAGGANAPLKQMGVIEEINMKISQAREKQVKATSETAIRAYQNEINVLNAKKKALMTAAPPAQNRSMKQLAADSTQAKMGMMNLQYTLRDAPYLFQNLQMGVTAVGENLLMTVTSMKAMKTEAGGMKNFMGLLTGALTGPAGFAVAMSAVLFLVQSFTIIMGKVKKKTKEASGEVEVAAWNFDILKNNVKDTKKVLDQLSFEQITESLQTVNDQIRKLERNNDALQASVSSGEDIASAFDIDYNAINKAKDIEKKLAEVNEKRSAIFNQFIKESKSGKFSATRIEEVLALFVAERDKQQKALDDRLGEFAKRSGKSVEFYKEMGLDWVKEWQKTITGTNKQIDELKVAQTELGDIENINLQIKEKSRQLEKAQGEEARKNLKAEIDALEEMQKKLRFEDPKKKEKKAAGKTDAELEQEFAAKKIALEEQLAVLQGERTQLEVLAAEETRLLEEQKTAKKERQKEIALELLGIEIEREQIALSTDKEREKAAEKHAANLDKIAAVEERIALQEQALALGGGAFETAYRRRYEMQTSALQAQKSAITERLNALQEELDTSTNLSELEKDARILQAKEMQSELLAIEQKLADEKRRLNEQEKRDAEAVRNVRLQALQTTYQAVTGMTSQMLAIDQQQKQQAIEVERQRREESITKMRDEALAHAVTTEQKDRINQQYADRMTALDSEMQGKSQKAAANAFKFQKLTSSAEAIINTYAAASKALKAGPILGPILAGVITATGLAYVAKINSQKAPAFASGGLVRVSNGEYYVDEKTTKENLPLLQMLNESGKIRGAGSGTSDSILAVANGGYVVNARATQQHESVLRSLANGGLVQDFNLPTAVMPSSETNEMREELASIRNLLESVLRYPPKATAEIPDYQTQAIMDMGSRRRKDIQL